MKSFLDMAIHTVLEPMNHREIEYNAKKLSGCEIPDAFSCAALLRWLDETGRNVFDEALVMDYGTDCLRLYLMFESTPKSQDAPYYESWQEGALEGLYRFLSRYRRMILVANEWNRNGRYIRTVSVQNIEEMQKAMDDTRQRIEKSIAGENTLSRRHTVIASLMGLQKLLQKELRINEIISGLHVEAIAAAVPHSADVDTRIGNLDDAIENGLPVAEIAEICREFIGMMAPFAPDLSRVLWKTMTM